MKQSYKIAMLYLAQNDIDENSSEDSEKEDSAKEEKLTLTQKSKVIEDSLDSYYSPVINAYLRRSENIGELMIAAQYLTSNFSSDALESFNETLSSLKIKILNAVGDSALGSNSLKEKWLEDPATATMTAKDLDKYVRSQLGDLRRETMIKVNKINILLES